MTPKISVIVPVYNVEKYLPRCIDSILSQTFTDFELLLIDDGSPDNCGKICDEYAIKDSRVKVIHKQNGGVSSARNVGIENATGEWITFIDADDYIEQGFLSLPKDATEDLLIQNYRVWNNEGLSYYNYEKKIITPSELPCFINNNIHREILCAPWAKFFRKNIVKSNKIFFIEGVKVGEDTLFVLDYLASIDSVHYIGLADYVYVGGFQENKYKLTVDIAIESLRRLVLRYDKLNAKSKKFLTNTFLLYYSLIHPKDYSSLLKWKKDCVVKRVYHIVCRDLGLKWRIVYAIYPFYMRLKKRQFK